MPVVHRPAGTPQGGQFAPGGTAGAPATKAKPKKKPKAQQEAQANAILVAIRAGPVKTPFGDVPHEAVAWQSTASAEQKAAIHTYTSSGGGYAFINRALREGKPMTAERQRTADGVAAAFAHAKEFSKPVTVYRGISGQMTDEQQKKMLGVYHEALASGQAVRMKGFQSTSLSDKIGAVFATTGLMLEIKAKKGLYLEGTTRFAGEYEMLLNHGSTFRVRNISTRYSPNDPNKTMVVVHLDQES